MKKNVLLIMSRLPYPPLGGDKLKSFNFLKILAKNYNVYLVVITDEKMDEETKEFIENNTFKYKIFRKAKWSLYLNTLKSLFNNKPIQVNYYYFNDVQRYINEISDETDFAIATLTRTSEYLLRYKKPKFLDMVDSIGLNYKRSKEKVGSHFWKYIYTIEASRLIDYEEKVIEIFDNTFFVNKSETNYWANYGKTTWIPNGVKNELFEYKKYNNKYKNYIGFFGNMNYQPNIDAVMWFVEKVFPKLNNNIKFIIIGIKPTQKVLSLATHKNIEVTGFVDDPYEILNSCFAVVAPMQTGGGIQNKILECMALGKINITTHLGAYPIVGAENDVHLIVANEHDMADKINKIFTKKENYQYIGENAKKLIKESYTWENYEQKLINLLNKAMSR